MTPSTYLLKVGALASVLMFVYLGTVLACDAPTDTKPIVMGIAGSTFVAVYNVSGTICLFQESSKHLTEGKVYLSNGQELKTVAPDVKLPTVESGVVISDKKNGHFIIFHHRGAGAPRLFSFTNAESAKEKTAVTLGDEPDLEAYPIYDIDKKNLVSGKATIPSASISSSAISSNEPMTVYSAELTPDSGWLAKYSYTGDDLPNATANTGSEYQLCAAEEAEGGNKGQQLVAKEMSKREDCKKSLPSSKDLVGFSDDTHFYLMNGSQVFTFGKDAIGDKVGKPVPYSLFPTSDFVHAGQPPGVDGNGSATDDSNDGSEKTTAKISLVGIVIFFIVLIICITPCIICCCWCCKDSKKNKKGGSSKIGKGKSRKSALKSGVKKSSRKSGIKSRSKKRSSLKSGRKSSSRGRTKRSQSRKVSSKKISGKSKTSAKASSKKSIKH